MTVVTRFAPSPTGFLHIGGARTALFNWLFARHHGGTYRLRIEDTDRARSTDEAVTAILDGLRWLELDWDGETVHQFAGAAHHAAIAQGLLATGHAYQCYCSREELADMREQARAEGRTRLYDGRWRDRDPSEAPEGVPPVLRLKVPLQGETVIDDLVQGQVTVTNDRLDDMILLRADGTPTYMLSVVVDDHDMGVSHIIRGDDHLTNAFRQSQIYRALEWDIPAFAHIPLIHGPDGGKLSKRHGALGVDAYRDMGYLPAALRNYLLRLSWSHGDDEVIDTAQAIAWFDLDAVGKSAARFDSAKLESLNGHYIRDTPDDTLLGLMLPILKKLIGAPMDAAASGRISMALEGLKPRANTVIALAESALFYVAKPPLAMTEKATKLLDSDAKSMLSALVAALRAATDWSETELETELRAFAEGRDLKFGKVAQPLRAALTGSTASPGIFEVMVILGRNEVLSRLSAI
jgi:glutamyl-tRNA synthetase